MGVCYWLLAIGELGRGSWGCEAGCKPALHIGGDERALVGQDSEGAFPADVEGDAGEEDFKELEVPIGVLDGHGGAVRLVGEGGSLGKGDSGFPEEIFEGEGLALGDPLFLWH